MAAVINPSTTDAEAKPTSENVGVLRRTLNTAREAAMLPARLAERVWETGRSTLVSFHSLAPGKFIGTAWGAAAEGAELFLMKLRMLLQRTRGGVLLLGAPEGCTQQPAAEPTAAGEQEKGGNGDSSVDEGASIKAEPEEPTAAAVQSELVAEGEDEPVAQPAEEEQPSEEEAEAESLEPAGEAAPAEAPLPEEKDEADEPPSPVVQTDDSTLAADVPSSPVAPAAPAADVQEPAAESGNLLTTDEAPPADEQEGETAAGTASFDADPEAAEETGDAAVPEQADIPAAAAEAQGLKAEAAPVEEAPAPPAAEAPPAAKAELAEADLVVVDEVVADGHPAASAAAESVEEQAPAGAVEADEPEGQAAAETAAGKEDELVLVVAEDGAVKRLSEERAGEAAADASVLPTGTEPAAKAAAVEEQLESPVAPPTPAKLAAASHAAPAPKAAALAAASEPEVVPSPRTPAASIVGGMRVPASSPKKKKRNPVHKVQKMLGLKSSGGSSNKPRH